MRSLGNSKCGRPSRNGAPGPLGRLARAALTAGLLIAAAHGNAAAALYPVDARAWRGELSGSYQALATLASSGDSAVWLKPDGSGFGGMFVYALPDDPAPGTAVEVHANLRGATSAEHPWSVELFDFSTRSWHPIGDNGAVPDGAWRTVTFTADDAADFVSADGELWVMFRAPGTNSPYPDGLQVDWLAVEVGAGAGGGTSGPTSHPDALRTGAGVSEGDLSVLATLESSSASALRLVPGGGGYKGFFDLPAPAGLSDGDALELTLHQRGPGWTEHRWRYYVFDFSTRAWILVGDNRDAGTSFWTSTRHPAGPVRDLVGPDGDAWVLLKADPGDGNDRLEVDWLALEGPGGGSEPPVEPPPAEEPPGVSARPVRPYLILGNGWDASQASSSELAWAADRFAVIQEARAWSAQDLDEAGAGRLLRYQQSAGPRTSSSDSSERLFRDRVIGAAPGYSKDIRMRKRSGGYMTHRHGFYLVDVVTPENRAIYRRILREKLSPLLSGSGGYDGVFLDTAGPHNPTAYPDQEAAPPGGYERDRELEGWIEVFAGLENDFPGKVFILNAHQPWGERGSHDHTGRELVLGSGVDGIMSESRMMTWGTVSGWTDETILDIESFIAAGKQVVVTHSVEDTDPRLLEQRHWGLATYLIATGASPLASYGVDGVVDPDHLPDLPEMAFEGLGAPIGPVRSLDGGRLFERRFERGRVVAHVKAGAGGATYDVPGNMERLEIHGGGAYPSGGRLSWSTISPGSRNIPAPSSSMPVGSALILRDRG